MDIPHVTQLKGDKGNYISGQYVIETNEGIVFQSDGETIFTSEIEDDENMVLESGTYKNHRISRNWFKTKKTEKNLIKFLNQYHIFGKENITHCGLLMKIRKQQVEQSI